jgi:hypothetical protein
MSSARLLGCTAALALLVAPAASAATSASGSSSVTADVANTLEATFPGNYAWGTLAAGATATSTEQVTTVKSNASWGVKIASDLADGRMKEWNGAAYEVTSPKILTNPLEWTVSSVGGAAQPAAWASFSNVQGLITGSQAGTDDSGRTVGVTYRQAVSYADENLGSDDYRISVSFTAEQGF